MHEYPAIDLAAIDLLFLSSEQCLDRLVELQGNADRAGEEIHRTQRQDAEDGLLAGKDGGGCRYRTITPTDEYRPMALHRSYQCFHDICALRQFHIRLMTVRMEDFRDRPDHFIGIAIAQRATVLIENHADFQKVRLRLFTAHTNV